MVELVNWTKAGVVREDELSVEELLPSDWLIGKHEAHSLD